MSLMLIKIISIEEKLNIGEKRFLFITPYLASPHYEVCQPVSQRQHLLSNPILL